MEQSNRQRWQQAWNDPLFRKKAVAGLIALLIVLTALPFFFQAIQRRTGSSLNDWILDGIPVYNMSVPIFICIWASALLSLIRLAQSPSIFIVAIWAYIFFTLSRMISIGLVPLEPPDRLLVLTDPLSNAFYGKSFITKDLFYSGHTGTVFLMFLVLRRKWDKILVLLASIAVGVMLLLQHVHYTIDVIGAFVFPYIVYRLSLKFAGRHSEMG